IEVLHADHSDEFWPGSWPVWVTAGEGRYPVEGAMIGLVQDDALLDAAYTAENGYAELTIDEIPYGSSVEGTVTVTFHNCSPYQAAVSPAPEGVQGPPSDAGSWLAAALPNPFTDMTVIRFCLPVACEYELCVFDVSGRLVRRLETGEATAGVYSSVWDGRDDAGAPAMAGVYFYRLRSPAGSLAQRCILLR
ncbi:T9SS type A sorting domain-containing protein, partial [Candidatus Fermentibacterales bacterium]|nr:T9SS type A sorting domain-containing protein [Candidatus Fermentibacterales bacterium]